MSSTGVATTVAVLRRGKVKFRFQPKNIGAQCQDLISPVERPAGAFAVKLEAAGW